MKREDALRANRSVLLHAAKCVRLLIEEIIG